MLSAMIVSAKVNDDEVITEYEFQSDDVCNICKIPLTSKNGSIVSANALNYDESRVYCTFCCCTILRKINELTAAPWDIKLCRNCKVPPKECKCNMKKIDYSIRKELK